MGYLANALSVPLDADKIAVYVREFQRRGVPEHWLEPMFLAACDAGFQYFPSVDALIELRPRRKALATAAPVPTPEQQREFREGYEALKAEMARLGIPKSMPTPKPPDELLLERQRQKQAVAKWAADRGLSLEQPNVKTSLTSSHSDETKKSRKARRRAC